MEYTGLDEEQRQQIVNQYYHKSDKKTESLEKPTIVLVGAQGGAGKTNIANLIKEELKGKGGFIHVDADRLRERIDDFQFDPKPLSEQTQPDAQKMVAALRAKTIADKKNILEEGTFRNPIDNFVSSRKNDGYAVEFVAVAASKRESKLGIYQRFESQIATNSLNPRFVNEEIHDNAFDGFNRTVAAMQNSFDRIRVINRGQETLHDSAAENNLHATPAEALTKGQTEDLKRMRDVATGWELVKEAALNRGRESDPHAGYVQDVEKNSNEATSTYNKMAQAQLAQTQQHLQNQGLGSEQQKIVLDRMAENLKLPQSNKEKDSSQKKEPDLDR